MKMTEKQINIANINIVEPLPQIRVEAIHHYESLLLLAKEAYSRQENELSVILCSCACEMLMERVFKLLFTFSNVEFLYDTIIGKQWEFNNITNKRNRNLYSLLSKDDLPKTFKNWSELCKHYDRRHEAAHRGVQISSEDAKKSLDTVSCFIKHIEEKLKAIEKPKD